MVNFGGDAGDLIKQLVSKIEYLEDEKTKLMEDIRGIYQEAKVRGLDVKILRKIITIRKQDPDKRAEEEELLDTYMHAMGMIEEEKEEELV